MGASVGRRARSRGLIGLLTMILLASGTSVGPAMAEPASGSGVLDVAGAYPTVPNQLPSVTPRTAVTLPTLPSTAAGVSANGGVGLRPTFVGSRPPSTVTAENGQWTANEQVYANPDGSYTAQVYGSKVNYRDPSGTWRPVDVTLVPTADDATYDLTTAANDVTLRLSDKDAANAAAQLQAGTYTIRLRAPGYGAAAPTVPTVSPSATQAAPSPTSAPPATVSPAPVPSPSPSPSPAVPAPSPTTSPTAPDASPSSAETPAASPTASATPTSSPSPALASAPTGVTFPGSGSAGDLTLVPTPEGFEFTVAIGSATAASVYAVVLDTGGLQARLGSDVRTIDLLDPNTGQAVGRVGAPGLRDAKGIGALDADVSVALVTPGEAAPSGVDPAAVAGLASSEVLLAYTIGAAWLQAAGRAYPVTLDPSVCIQYGGAGCTSGFISTFVMEGRPDNYPVGWTVDRIGVDGAGTGYGLMRTLQYFQDVTLPDGAQVTAGTLDLHQVNNYGDSTTKFLAQEITGQWDTQVTWNTPQPTTTTTHQSPSITPCSSSCAKTLDVVDIVRDWYTRRSADWKANLGFELRLQDESKPEVRFDNASTATVANRPKLTISYVVPQVLFDFAAALGPDFAPSAMVVGQDSRLPLVIKNNSGFTWQHTNGADGWRYRVGYRWLDAKGAVVNSNVYDLSADIATGSQLAQTLTVTPPATAGQYTLRLDLVLSLNGQTKDWASDWAKPTLYYSRDKRSFSPANTRWTGSSVIERDEFPINVVLGGGTALGEVKSVALGDGGSLGINLWSRDVAYTGSGGVGFSDLLPISLDYGYDSANAADCSGILGACGWWTNWDERLTMSSEYGDYVYQMPDGNRYLVGTDTNGQLLSRAPVSLQRQRFTLLDDNVQPWSSAPTYDTGTAYNGSAFSTSIAAGLTGGTNATLAVRVPLNPYPQLNFSVKVSATTVKGALAVQIVDQRNGGARWFGYGFGPAWTIPGMSWQTNLGSASTSWPTFPASSFTVTPWSDAANNASLFNGGGYIASSSDPFAVMAVELIGGGGSGTIWFDGAYLNQRVSNAYDDTMPAWTQNQGNASLNTTDVAVGTASLQIAPVPVGSSPSLQGLSNLLSGYPFDTWRWKKVGGTTIAHTFTLKDVRTNATGTITYYAGENKGYTNAIQVSASLPTAWTRVTRNLEDDARQVLGFYNDNPAGDHPVPVQGPSPDELQRTGYQLVAYDGQYALFDAEGIWSQSAIDDATFASNEDIVATEADGVQHYFNRDGLLERVRDRDGNAITLDWSYDYATAGLSDQARYTLTAIHAPADGQALSAGTAQRELQLSYPANAVKFSEALGSTTSATGRATQFVRDAATKDLLTVIPARYAAGACAGSGPTGCLKFDYSGTHLLADVIDPRSTGSDNQKTTITYTGNDAQQISDASTNQPELRVLGYDTDATHTYLRPLWQDQPGLRSNTARYVELSPDGSVQNEYVPKACSGTCTAGSPSTYPAAPVPGDLATSYAFDGVGRVSSVISYRTPGNGQNLGQQVVTRRATNAAVAVDNLNDPLSAAETLWEQSPDQYYASHAAGNDELYRTSYAYNEFHERITTVIPHSDPAPAYATAVGSPGGLAGYWRLGEGAGSTIADSSGLGHNGTLSGGYTLGTGGALVGDANRAITFNGTSGYAQIGSTGTISGAFTVVADVKPATTAGQLTFLGSRGPGNTYGFKMDLEVRHDAPSRHRRHHAVARHGEPPDALRGGPLVPDRGERGHERLARLRQRHDGRLGHPDHRGDAAPHRRVQPALPGQERLQRQPPVLQRGDRRGGHLQRGAGTDRGHHPLRGGRRLHPPGAAHELRRGGPSAPRRRQPLPRQRRPRGRLERLDDHGQQRDLRQWCQPHELRRLRRGTDHGLGHGFPDRPARARPDGPLPAVGQGRLGRPGQLRAHLLAGGLRLLAGVPRRDPARRLDHCGCVELGRLRRDRAPRRRRAGEAQPHRRRRGGHRIVRRDRAAHDLPAGGLRGQRPADRHVRPRHRRQLRRRPAGDRHAHGLRGGRHLPRRLRHQGHPRLPRRRVQRSLSRPGPHRHHDLRRLGPRPRRHRRRRRGHRHELRPDQPDRRRLARRRAGQQHAVHLRPSGQPAHRAHAAH